MSSFWPIHALHPDCSRSLVKPLLWVIILCLSVASLSSRAETMTLEDCEADKLVLQPWLSALEDGSGRMDLSAVTALPTTAWEDVTARHLTTTQKSSALWLQLNVRNNAPRECRFWLFPGTAKARDMSLFQREDGAWVAQYAGAHYPLNEWENPIRLPAFPVVLAAQQEQTIYLRMASDLRFSMQPMLLSHDRLLSERMAESLADGVVFGIVLLLVLFSLAAGYILRLPLLFAHAMSVLSYVLLVALIAGYGFVYLWPGNPQLDLILIEITGALTRFLVFVYLRILLMVRKQPALSGYLMTLCQIMIVLVALGNLMLPPGSLLAQAAAELVRLFTVGVLLWVLVTGIRQGLRYGWFVYLVTSLVIIQSLAFLAFHQGLFPVSPYEYSWFSVSTLPGAALLTYTLVSQIALSRRREKQALDDIERLKQTEQERLAHQVDSRTTQLRESLNAQGFLLARISHDLRAPMQGVVSSARQLRQNGVSAQEASRNIERFASQQLELIDELLEFSSSELRQKELMIAPGYLFGFLDDVQLQGRLLAQSNANHFESILSSDLPTLVNADFRRLRQVLVNLLANAAKFTRNGQIRFTVEPGATAAADRVALRFCVEDSGRGVSAVDWERLTRPFGRGDNASGEKGVGLGLFIVKQMLERMGSQLELEKSSLGGAAFSFELLLDPAGEQEVEQSFIESYEASVVDNGSHVLVVDDSPMVRDTLSDLLGGYGYDVVSCEDVDQALESLQNNAFELIICDQSMPGKSGWVLLEQVRRRWPQLQMMLYSGIPPRRPEQLAPSIDFDSYLLKPATSGDLLGQVRHLLHSHSREPARNKRRSV
ncbi:hybrid sensor histidine kinase/response regulator [Halopseudomonas salegens]|uniref:hybrid sensor histidine kinase/response regulator n=1 Tax=Halopseudomonas salegens TaxID=1434072 RepID=UPI001E5F1B39|nr:hybrid sensor histidine kinase/response regulator [Halopseudomonas salegens]